MKSFYVAAILAALTASAASAETIGVSMQSFDNNFQTLLREGLSARASHVGGVTLQIEDAQTDVSKQLNQVNNFIAAGVDAIIVTLADTSAAPGISAAAEKAGIPLVYLNLQPDNVDKLPQNQAYVGSKETDSGRLGAEAACEILKKNGKADDAQAYILMGDLARSNFIGQGNARGRRLQGRDHRRRAIGCLDTHECHGPDHQLDHSRPSDRCGLCQ
ncbi:ABC-type sugar transport system, periplasmic component [Rhizobium sp. CF142]|nr:ABC-type sugar transport system, periplasmic component [Rhizobium sp. CF142]